MENYVDLGRRFRILADTELAEFDRLADLQDVGTFGTVGWEDLLEAPRVVLLAEAGSGKSWEMEAQVRKLKNSGKTAFFLPLEAIAREDLTASLTAGEEREFFSWLQKTPDPGWFFLDSVDELKLNQQKFETALKRFAKALDGCLARAYVTISSRPSDWGASTDLAKLSRWLPFGEPTTKIFDQNEAFLDPLRQRTEHVAQDTKQKDRATPKVAALLPLSRGQIEAFSSAKASPASKKDFIAELSRQNAWDLVRRPLDLSELLNFWQVHHRLGTRRDQLETNIATKLSDDPDRLDTGVLSEQQARRGAERLALALALTRKRTISIPDRSAGNRNVEDALDPATVLPDWTHEQRASLLRRALFDPATYERVRFHHRSVQEYLAACRLRYLRDDKGMSISALFRLLLAERYGTRVVIPSMAPIGAWCALWSSDVRREIMHRQPELLIEQGDPGSLLLEDRIALIRAFVNAYSDGKRRGMDLELDAVRRLGHPELTELVNDLWEQGPTNDDVINLLLKLIWQGPLPGCAKIAKEAAFAHTQEPYTRILGIWALAAIGDRADLREIAKSLLDQDDLWPDRIVTAAVPELFPHSLTLEELFTLIERTPQPESSISGFRYAARGIALEIDLHTHVAIALRDRLRQLIWDHRGSNLDWYDLKSSYSYLTPALAVLCARQLDAMPRQAGLSEIMEAAIVALRFRSGEYSVEKYFEKLRTLIAGNPLLRRLAFWLDLDLLAFIESGRSDISMWIELSSDLAVASISEQDLSWLIEDLANPAIAKRRGVALEALGQLWLSNDCQTDQLERMRLAVSDEPVLQDRLEKIAHPRQPNPKIQQIERERDRRRKEHEDRERERIQKWQDWRENLCTDPDTAFSGEREAVSIANLHYWLKERSGSMTSRNCWIASAVSEAFGDAVLLAARDALMRHWRKGSPELWSQRPNNERNTYLYTWLYGLTGLYAEAETPGWSAALSDQEAETAAAYATVEINELPDWLTDLLGTHPRAIDLVLGKELSAQLDMADEEQFIPLLQHIAHGPFGLKRLLAPRILAGLQAWPLIMADEERADRSSHTLNQAMEILAEVLEGEDRERVVTLCQERVRTDPSERLSFTWLRGLFRFDGTLGTDLLEWVIDETPEAARDAKAVDLFDSLFHRLGANLFGSVDSPDRPQTLKRLLHACYRHVAPNQDPVREGVFTPTKRDNAAETRSDLLGLLRQSSGPEAHRAILELADDPYLGNMRERLLLFAREQAGRDAEPPSFSIDELRALESRLEAPPRDKDSLFDLMMSRLDDLQHDIAHHDFTDRRILQGINEEADMQRTLARRILDASRGSYSIVREDEVADLKKPDIRLTTNDGAHRAAIEIKIADNDWSVRDLERALETQLVGQYLRHESTRAGCLLLTYSGRKTYWQDPHSGARLDFESLCDSLRDRARSIENDRGFDLRLGVFGLDLRDPPL